MALRTLQKWHGAGNDFLVDVIEHGTATWWDAERARAVCNRYTGVGADGLLLATLGSHVEMVLFNADGSTAEMSGNGIRCLAAAVRRATHATWSSLAVMTAAGMRDVALAMNEDGGYGSVAMGAVSFAAPLEGSLGVVNVGNPHVVVLDDPSWSDAQREDRAREFSHAVGGANVEFVTPLDQDHVRIKVMERGVGWTLACGTGSVATAAICQREGLCANDVIVENPGGPLRVQVADGEATLSGPVQFVANIEWLEV
ncbi:MAG: diaminopimelate epimerase [Acidobacteria bacterium]|nr:diaminopimelate epimerase [Acidobacteriota bacterium]